MTSPRRVVLAGHSNVTFTEEGEGFELPNLLRQRLVAVSPAEPWECYPAYAPIGRPLTDVVDEALRDLQPEVVVLCFTATSFAHEFVTNRIRRRWRRLYDPALKLSQLLKAGAGATDPNFTPRRLLFRLPEELFFHAIGGEPVIRVERAIEHARAAIDLLVRHEDVVSIVRLPGPTAVITGDRIPRYAERVRQFNEAVIRHSEERRVPWYNFEGELGSLGRGVTFARDGIHFRLSTRRDEAEITATQVLCHLDVAAGRPSRAGAATAR